MTLPKPVEHRYFIISRHSPGEHEYRWPLDDKGAEMRFGSFAEAEYELHEHFVPGIEACIEEVTAVHRPVEATVSLGSLRDRAKFWAHWWTRLGRVRGFRGNARITAHVERATGRLQHASRLAGLYT